MSEQWGPWIEHDGKGCPANLLGCVVHLWLQPEDPLDLPREGVFVVTPLMASCSSWESARYWGRGHAMQWGGRALPVCWVTRYRIRRPRGMEIIDQILADVPERVDA